MLIEVQSDTENYDLSLISNHAALRYPILQRVELPPSLRCRATAAAPSAPSGGRLSPGTCWDLSQERFTHTGGGPEGPSCRGGSGGRPPPEKLINYYTYFTLVFTAVKRIPYLLGDRRDAARSNDTLLQLKFICAFRFRWRLVDVA